MKQFIQYFSILLFLCPLLHISCKKSFLQTNSQPEITVEKYIQDLATLEHFYNGLYAVFTRDYEHGVGAAYPELAADNLKPTGSGAGMEAPLAYHYTWNQQYVNPRVARAESIEKLDPESKACNGIWSGSGYSIIRLCDYLLEEVSKYRSDNPAKADQFKGEVLAMRALIHFRLVNIFAQPYNYTVDASHAGIPYITSSDITSTYHRSTVKEVYDRIIEDFQEALGLLPQEVTDTRKINRDAVKGLLARIYLFKEDYVSAKQLSEELIEVYPLLTIANGYPDALFKYQPTVRHEVLFQLAPIHIQNTLASYFLNVYCRRSNTFYFRPTKDISGLLTESPGDVRGNWVLPAADEYLVNKFPSGVANVTPAMNFEEASYYSSMIRVSEMVLTAAEAAAKLNQEDVARNYLDMIRQRANNSAAPVTATGTALLDSIYKERRKELCFEGLRLFDLQRWNLGVHRTDVHPDFPSAKDLNYPSDKTIAPIPYEEVTLANLIPNPGY